MIRSALQRVLPALPASQLARGVFRSSSSGETAAFQLPRMVSAARLEEAREMLRGAPGEGAVTITFAPAHADADAGDGAPASAAAPPSSSTTIATILLDNTTKRNALSGRMMLDLEAAFRTISVTSVSIRMRFFALAVEGSVLCDFRSECDASLSQSNDQRHVILNSSVVFRSHNLGLRTADPHTRTRRTTLWRA